MEVITSVSIDGEEFVQGEKVIFEVDYIGIKFKGQGEIFICPDESDEDEIVFYIRNNLHPGDNDHTGSYMYSWICRITPDGITKRTGDFPKSIHSQQEKTI